jgi:hypothetical protein
MVTKRLVLLPLLAALTLLAAGCGKSSKPETANEWANDFCGAVSTWKDSLTSTASSLQGGNLSKDTIQSAFDDFKSATKTFTDDVKGLGKPPTQAGDEAKQSVDNLSNEVNDQVEKVQGAVNDASTASGILNVVTVASSALSTLTTDVQSTFNDLKQLEPGGELQTAFQQADNCKSLTSSS